MRLNLVEVEDLSTFWDGIVKELGRKAARAFVVTPTTSKLARVGV